jgi:hypothetical protein
MIARTWMGTVHRADADEYAEYIRGALLRCADPGQAEGQPPGSDRQDQFVESDRHSPAGGLLHRQLVVSAAKVLHQGVSGDDHPGTAVLFEPAHRTRPRLQPPMVALDPIVGVPVAAMPGRRQQLLQHPGYTGA